MEISKREVLDVTVVDLKGHLQSNTQGHVSDEPVKIIEDGARKMVLNLAEVDYLSSAGLRVILRSAKLINGFEGELKICSPTSDVRNVLDMSGFNSLLKVYESENEAVRAF